MKAGRWAKGDELKKSCPLCGGVLVVRENAKTSNLFVGCRSFPSCRMNRPIRMSDKKKDTSGQEPPTGPASMSEAGERTGTLCSVCEKPQFRSPGGVTCEKGHGGAASIDPGTGEITYPDDAPDPFEKHAGEPGILVDDPEHSEECKENTENQPGTCICGADKSQAPELSDVFEQDCGYRLHVQVTLEPVDAELDVLRADMDVDGIPIDLDRARMRRDAGHNVALEITGRLLPRIVETMRRVTW